MMPFQPVSSEDSPEEEKEVTQRRPGNKTCQRKLLLLSNVTVHDCRCVVKIISGKVNHFSLECIMRSSRCAAAS